MLTMILLGFYTLLEETRMANFTAARLGRQIEAGGALYDANCSTCHGVNGLGSNGGTCYDPTDYTREIPCVGLATAQLRFALWRKHGSHASTWLER